MKTVGLLLAAGHSRRFGPQNKLLTTFHGRPLVTYAAETVRDTGLDGLIAVVSDDNVAEHLADFSIVRPDAMNPEQSDSLRAGVQASLDFAWDRILVVLGDMPLVTGVHLRAVVDRCTSEHASASTDGQRRSPPACFPASIVEELLALRGDRGAGSLLRKLPSEALVEASVDMLKDVDVVGDLD